MKLIGKYSTWLLAAAATLTLTLNATSQEFTGSSKVSLKPQPPITEAVKPTLVMPNSSYVTAGIALRNRGAGNISVSGLVGAPRATFIYWAVICGAACPAAATQIEIQRLYPAPASAVAVLAGAPVGIGPAPCWGGGNTLTVFRAMVPGAIATGNGSYQVTIPAGGQFYTNGSSPWSVAFNVPAWEGASLVMVGRGVGTVSIYDKGLAGTMFTPVPAFTYTLALPVPAPPLGNSVFFDNIGADGQHLVPRAAALTVSDETTRFNGVPFAGPGSTYNDSDWNGSAGLWMPELWDDTAHNITGALNPGAALLNVSVSATGFPVDCLSLAVNVVQEN